MEAEVDLTDRTIRLATSVERPFVRSPLWIASKSEDGEFPASSEKLRTLVGTPDPREEEAVVEDPRKSPTDPEATSEKAKRSYQRQKSRMISELLNGLAHQIAREKRIRVHTVPVNR